MLLPSNIDAWLNDPERPREMDPVWQRGVTCDWCREAWLQRWPGADHEDVEADIMLYWPATQAGQDVRSIVLSVCQGCYLGETNWAHGVQWDQYG